MTEIIDFSDLSNVPDGDYPTGKMLTTYPSLGSVNDCQPYPEVVVIENHEIVCFRNRNGDIVFVPQEGNFDFPFPPFVPPTEI